MPSEGPRLLVLSSLFPHAGQPAAGSFVRERMFRVGQQLPMVVFAPTAWFPLQSLVRRFRPFFRVPVPYREVQQGIEIIRPRFLSVPGLFKSLDGFSMAIACFLTLRKLGDDYQFDIIDAHFAYPEGYAGSLLGKWLRIPVTITLRGTESRHLRTSGLRSKLLRGLNSASRVFSVANSLKQEVVEAGLEENKVLVVGNGVDTEKFALISRSKTREELGLAADAPVIISVGGLVERKGFHRVIELLPDLLVRFPGLVYLVVGTAGPEGDWGERLLQQVKDLGVSSAVRFLGAVPHEELSKPLSAADIFVLATSNEGWANVFLEAMACGLPVITTTVGGNAEVVCRDELGTLVPFGEPEALLEALTAALGKEWSQAALRAYAMDNSWEQRVAILVREFNHIKASALGRQRN